MRISLSYVFNQNNLESKLLEHKIKLNQALSISGLFGESGTGKSSLLKALSGLLPSQQCSIEDNQLSYVLSYEQPKPSSQNARLNPCVYVGQGHELFGHMNVMENLLWLVKHAHWRSNPFFDSHVLSYDEVLELFQLHTLLEQSVSSLSAGETQRVKFARAVLSAKPILLLDEAFSALDWKRRIRMHEILRQLVHKHKFRCILVSHSLEELSLCCDELLWMKNGEIVKQGPQDELLDSLYQLPSDVLQQQCFSVLKASYSAQEQSDQHLQIWEIGDNKRQFLYVKSAIEGQDCYKLNKSSSFIIHADKISLFVEYPLKTSMLNKFKVSVESFTSLSDGVMLVLSFVDNDDDSVLRATITKKSFEELNIDINQHLYAVFKAL